MRRWSLRKMKALGRITQADYQDNGTGEMLRHWVEQLSTNQEVHHLGKIVRDNSPLRWSAESSRCLRALGDCLDMMEESAIEQFAGHCPSMFDMLIENIISESSQTYGLNSLSSSSISEFTGEKLVSLHGLTKSLRCILREIGGRLWLVSSKLLTLGPLELLGAISKIINQALKSVNNDLLGCNRLHQMFVSFLRLARHVVKAISELKWRWRRRSDYSISKDEVVVMEETNQAESEPTGYVFKHQKPVCVSLSDEDNTLVASANTTALMQGTEAVLYCCAQMQTVFVNVDPTVEPHKDIQRLQSEVLTTICETLVQFYSVVSPHADENSIKEVA